jgi:ADP-L-glycero-D-manno-heptose 6-epimerase
VKVLITGHQGFIGSNLRQYLEAYRHEVHGYEYDARKFPKVNGYDCVVHLGAISSTTYRDVEQIMHQNYDFSCRLLQACNRQGVNFQYASSASVYGSGPEFSEGSPPQPQSPYAWSKWLFDRYVTQHKWKVHVQGFRYFNVYGEGESHKGDQASPVHKFSRQAQENGVIELFEGSDKYFRDFVCVYDVCSIHHAFLEMSVSGVWNVGTGTPESFQNIGEGIADKFRVPIRWIPMPQALVGQYQAYTCADLSRLNQLVQKKWINVLDYLRGQTSYRMDTPTVLQQTADSRE